MLRAQVSTVFHMAVGDLSNYFYRPVVARSPEGAKVNLANLATKQKAAQAMCEFGLGMHGMDRWDGMHDRYGWNAYFN